MLRVLIVKKHWFNTLHILLFSIVIVSCGGSGNSETVTSNVFPTVFFLSPLGLETVFPYDHLNIQVEAEDSDGKIVSVKFFVDDKKIGEVFTTPFEFVWNGLEKGSYEIKAVVTDDCGATAESRISINTGNVAHVPLDFTIIQDAINSAEDGDLVLVSPGRYGENLTISGKRIALTSQFFISGSDVEQTVIDGGGDTVITIRNSEGSKIVGFTLQNGDDGISVDSTTQISNNHFVKNFDGIDYEGGGGVCRDNVFTGNFDDGVDLDGATQVNISNNFFIDNFDDGIEIRLHPYSGPMLTVQISNNDIRRCGEDGIQLIDHEGESNRYFVIKNNLIVDSVDAGLGIMDEGATVEDFRGAPVVDLILLINNTFVGNGYGVSGGANILLLNNIISGTINYALNNVSGGSMAAYTLFWDNSINFVNSNIDLDNNIFLDPLFEGNYQLSSGSPAIDTGTSFFVWQDEVVFDASEFLYDGFAPDLGTFEFIAD